MYVDHSLCITSPLMLIARCHPNDQCNIAGVFRMPLGEVFSVDCLLHVSRTWVLSRTLLTPLYSQCFEGTLVYFIIGCSQLDFELCSIPAAASTFAAFELTRGGSFSYVCAILVLILSRQSSWRKPREHRYLFVCQGSPFLQIIELADVVRHTSSIQIHE